jgi:uncharacterized protein YdaU (DUF1376 family)
MFTANEGEQSPSKGGVGMAALPFMKFFPDAWRRDVRRLSLASRGCYIELLSEMWISHIPYLINDTEVLARIVGVSSDEFLSCWNEIQRKGFEIFSITSNGEMIFQKRLLREWTEALEKSDKARASVNKRYESQSDHDTNVDTNVGTNVPPVVPTEVKNLRGKDLDTKTLRTKDIKTYRGVEGETTPAPIPYKEIVNLYNNILSPDLPEVKSLNDRRRKALTARWKEKAEYRTLDFWDGFFQKVKNSDHLMGKSPAKEGYDKPFSATFDWLIDSKNFDKVNENNYRNRKFKSSYQAAADMDPDEILSNLHRGFAT